MKRKIAAATLTLTMALGAQAAFAADVQPMQALQAPQAVPFAKIVTTTIDAQATDANAIGEAAQLTEAMTVVSVVNDDAMAPLALADLVRYTPEAYAAEMADLKAEVQALLAKGQMTEAEAEEALASAETTYQMILQGTPVYHGEFADGTVLVTAAQETTAAQEASLQ